MLRATLTQLSEVLGIQTWIPTIVWLARCLLSHPPQIFSFSRGRKWAVDTLNKELFSGATWKRQLSWMPLGIVSLVLHNCEVEFAADMKLLGIFDKINSFRGVLTIMRKGDSSQCQDVSQTCRLCSSCGATQPPIKSWASLPHLELPCLRESVLRCTPFESVVKVRHDIPNS